MYYFLPYCTLHSMGLWENKTVGLYNMVGRKLAINGWQHHQRFRKDTVIRNERLS